MRLRGFIFDLDGTIVETDYDWSKIRREIGCERMPILSYLELLTEPERTKKLALLQRYEAEATSQARLKEGVKSFLEFLRSKKIKLGLVTNNTLGNTQYLLTKFSLTFDEILTRETGFWKPSKAPMVEMIKRLGLNISECAAVGDSIFDIQSAEAAGIPFIFIVNPELPKFMTTSAITPSSSSSLKVFSNIASLHTFIENQFFKES